MFCFGIHFRGQATSDLLGLYGLVTKVHEQVHQFTHSVMQGNHQQHWVVGCRGTGDPDDESIFAAYVFKILAKPVGFQTLGGKNKVGTMML